MRFMNTFEDNFECCPTPRSSRARARSSRDVEKFAHLVQKRLISTVPARNSDIYEHIPRLFVTVPTFANILPALVAALRAECTILSELPFSEEDGKAPRA